MAEKAYVIHLERAKTRRKEVDRILEAGLLPTEMVPAVDGRELTPAAVANCYQRNQWEPRYPFELQLGEIGCFLSHRECWRRIVAEKVTAGLILEDDIEMDVPAFSRALAVAQKHVATFGFIQFQVRQAPKNSEVVLTVGAVRLLRPAPILLRTSAQLVSQEAAQRLLKLTEVFDRPVDTFLQMHWLTGLKLVCAVPAGITDRTLENGGSTISSRKPILEKAARTWKRWQYRSQIKQRRAG